LKIVFDTNVILDVLLVRESHFEVSANLFDAVVCKDVEGYLCATTLTTIDYLVSKQQGKQVTRALLKKLLVLFSIAEVNEFVLMEAVKSDFSDFEDAVLYQAGVLVGVDGFVTRNQKDFKTAVLSVYSPCELLEIIKNNK